MLSNDKKHEQEYPPTVSNDEIDLVQLVQILLKRKYLILVVIFLCLLIGGGYAFFKERVYLYTTTLQIGEVLSGGEGSTVTAAIEAPPSVKLKIENVYIPEAVKKINEDKENRFVSTVVREKKNSNIVFVESRGRLEDQRFVSKFHSLIVAPLIENHREAVSALKRQFELSADEARLVLKELGNPAIFGAEEKELQQLVVAARIELAGFDDRKKLLLAKKSGFGETVKLLRTQIEYLEQNLELSRAKRNRAISETNNATKAMTFLLLNNEIQKNENKVATLKERLYVKLENEKQEVESQLAENKRTQEIQTAKIEELKEQLVKWKAQHLSDLEKQRNVVAVAKNKLDMFQNTHVLGLSMLSLKSVGTGKILIFALSGILGITGGIILAFFVEFMTKVMEEDLVKK